MNERYIFQSSFITLFLYFFSTRGVFPKKKLFDKKKVYVKENSYKRVFSKINLLIYFSCERYVIFYLYDDFLFRLSYLNG